MNFIFQIDKEFFLIINHLPHNFLFDAFFSLLSGIGYSGIVWFIIGIILFFWEELKDKNGLYALVIAGLMSLVLVELGLKNLVGRIRPQFIILETIVVGSNIDYSFSFPSGHATIAFASAYVLAFYHRKWRWFYYSLAIFISFSRIYLGKHYPSDIFAGMLIGLIIGMISIKISNLIKLKIR